MARNIPWDRRVETRARQNKAGVLWPQNCKREEQVNGYSLEQSLETLESSLVTANQYTRKNGALQGVKKEVMDEAAHAPVASKAILEAGARAASSTESLLIS